MNIPVQLKQIIAFTKRDFYSWSTYRTLVITQILSILIGVFSWGINASYVQKPVNEMYGSDYISFLVVGVAIGNLIMPLVQGMQRQLNPWTLETVLMTGISRTVFVIGNVMWSYVFSVLSFIPYLFIGTYFFGARLNVNLLATALAFGISALILIGLAMIATGLRIVTKSTDPISWVLNVLQNLFAGISFPVIFLDKIFFPGASMISWFLPQTWVYHLCRLAMLTKPSLTDPSVLLQFGMGSLFAVILFPLGWRIFEWGLTRAKKEGTLGWY